MLCSQVKKIKTIGAIAPVAGEKAQYLPPSVILSIEAVGISRYR